jgi:bifunctional oligoribonuclease and PAP phosphatase NrnA
MELTPKAQAVELIRSSQNILILTHQDPDGDALGSALALQAALKKIEKTADVAISGRLNPSLEFLPGVSTLSKKLEASSDLLLTIDTRSTGEDLRLGHKKSAEDHRVTIIISPQRGTLVPEDVTITRSGPKYDLVIVLDTADLSLLGDILADFPDLLYETPTISIDHHPTNSYFAKVNWVDMTSTSTAEMLVSLIESLGRQETLLDADIATCLLTGLITDTDSFQNMNTTPKSLTVAAQLIAAGARQQEIVEKIYRTKRFITLKLWGKILSNIQENRELRFAWATLRESEMREVGADPDESKGGLIDELLKSIANVDFVFLLSEKGEEIHGSLRSVKPSYNVAEIAKLFGGGGHVPAAGFALNGTLDQQEEQIIRKITEFVRSKSAKSSLILPETILEQK